MEGFLINNPEYLENGTYYVAVGSEYGGFKKANYGAFGRPSFKLPGKLDHRYMTYPPKSMQVFPFLQCSLAETATCRELRTESLVGSKQF